MADFFTIPVPFATPAYDDTIGLRDEILRRPLGLEFHPKDLATEFDSIHLACYHSSWELVGCLVLVPKSNSIIKMRQVAVREDQQGRGIGKLLVKESEVLARELGYKKMVLNARDIAIPFYEKLNYQKVGDAFYEVTILHYKMEKEL
jgi:predicted GNAT family N-acyltransferase